MIIEVNTKLLHMQEEINLNQLFFLSMILDKNQKSNQDVRKIVSLISDEEISYLITQGLITSIESGDAITYLPSDKLKEVIKPNKTYFDQFYDMYPTYVIRPDGTKNYLRTNVNKCRKMFDNVTGQSSAMAEHLINCLNLEIHKKMSQGKIGYMKTMWRWLCDHQWEEIEAELSDVSTQQITAYGTELI